MLYKIFCKSIADVLLAAITLLLVFPFLLILATLLYASQKTNPFFIQERVGLNNRIFKLVKFRTMSNEKDHHGKLLSDAQRLTKIGKVVRSTSLDEIPQLWNVLKGDMSLIGPRPLLVKYLPLYNERQARRHEVKPGISGWAQVNGRNAISWQQRFELDLYYVENLSFRLDFKILLLTIKNVLKRKGISAQGNATMEAFKGN
jgi:undecaprenyl phosphate N,N'-diacetylbacillosamine 1-phosphate transferase